MTQQGNLPCQDQKGKGFSLAQAQCPSSYWLLGPQCSLIQIRWTGLEHFNVLPSHEPNLSSPFPLTLCFCGSRVLGVLFAYFELFPAKYYTAITLVFFPGKCDLSLRGLCEDRTIQWLHQATSSSVFSHHSLHKLDFKILSKILLEKKRLGPVDRSDDSASLCPGTTWNKPQKRKFSATKFKLGYKSHLFSYKLVSFLLIMF